jgi:hypothetical protein
MPEHVRTVATYAALKDRAVARDEYRRRDDPNRS